MADANTSQVKVGKELYGYQKDALQEIFNRFETAPQDYHLLYQLPTGGGKTVIFSEIVRRYIETFKKKVLVLTIQQAVSMSRRRTAQKMGFHCLCYHF